MEKVRTLIVGAGMSALSTAAALEASGDSDYLVLEGEPELGGYCKTIKKDGFVWDYSGHFFHFKHPEIEAWLRQRMPGQNIRTVQKKSRIDYFGVPIDFPFQKNIHQLPREDFIECLHDLYFANGDGSETNFKDMLYGRLVRGICEKFLIPYNEKLYACDLSTLDKCCPSRNSTANRPLVFVTTRAGGLTFGAGLARGRRWTKASDDGQRLASA